mgnify:CR=1 FL=1
MSVALYLDVHVPATITDGLRQRKVDVLTAQEDGAAEFEDPDLLTRTSALGRALFSQDSDLLAEARRRQRDGTYFAGVIYAHQQALSISRFIEELEIIGKAGQPEDLANQVTFLPMR